jgi:uncharacterized membrane protein
MVRNRNKKKPGQSMIPASQLPTGSASPRPSGNTVQLTASRTELHTGPLPHPDILARYDQILPGAAERIIRMAEHQQDHRMTMESTVIRSDVNQARWGLICGFVLSVIVISVSGYLIGQGHDIAGGALGGLDLVSLVGVFIYGSRTRRAERLEKANR